VADFVGESKETSQMDALDNKIEKLNKADLDEPEKELKPEKDNKIEVKHFPDEEASDEDQDKEDSKGKLVSHILDLAKKHHKEGNSDNVKDLSKFLVHLHKDGSEEIKDLKSQVKKSCYQLIKNKNELIKSELLQQKAGEILSKALEEYKKIKAKKACPAGAVKEGVPVAEKACKKSEEEKDKEVKKSLDQQIIDYRAELLEKAEDRAKKTKDELKEIFELGLKDMIKDLYYGCKKKYPNLSREESLKKLKDKINEQVVRRMSWDDGFLLGKRAVDYSDKYLSSVIAQVDLEKIDEDMTKEVSNGTISPMYYSQEGYRVFALGSKTNKVLEALEKGNNFFGKSIVNRDELTLDLKELDIEVLEKSEK